MSAFKKRQIRTMVLLLLVFFGSVGAGLYFRYFRTTKPVSSSASTVSEDIQAAMTRYNQRTEDQSAMVRTEALAYVSQKAELVFAGLPPVNSIDAFLEALSDSAVKPQFFVSGADVSNYPETITKLMNHGYVIGTLGNSNNDLVDASGETAIGSLCRAIAAMQTAAGVQPTQLLCFKQPSEQLKAAAYACYIDTIVVPESTVEISELTSYAGAFKVVNETNRGGILCVRLYSTYPDTAGNTACIVSALNNSDLSIAAKEQTAILSSPAEPQMRVYTTDRAVGFTFSGLGNSAELKSLLASMQSIGGRGTFFITRDELTEYEDDIRLILDGGHELGIAVQSAKFSSAASLLQELLLTQEGIRTTFAYQKPLAVRPTYGSATETLKAVCGSGGFTLLTSMVNAVRTEDIRKTDPQTIVDSLLPESEGYLQRGEIVHFQMKQFQQSNTMLGQLVVAIATKRSLYTVKPVMEMMSDTQYTYTYPVPEDKILPEVKDKIHPGQLTSTDISTIAPRYIGIDWVNVKSFLPGFSSQEINRLDKKGLLTEAGNRVFLTFDDWGTDKVLTEILDVLKAHNAKATFFIRTENVVYNPNLLRAIALEGHTIGSHTHTHFPLSNDTGNGKKFTELTTEQVAQLKSDLVTSYEVLESIIGDVSVAGKPALSRLFRPPTLAMSRNGLCAVLDCGFTYSVSGYFTSQDYKAKNAESLAKSLASNTKNGAIIILHMSDNSVYTAPALQQYFEKMELRDVDKQFTFVSLSDVLQ